MAEIPGMTGMPSLGLSFGIDPQSSAGAGGGDWTQNDSGINMGGYSFGSIGDGGGTGNTPISGLVRDMAVGVAVALLAKYLWKYVK